MASVTLTKIWIHDSRNVSDYVTIDASALREDAGGRGEVRFYATGRLREFTRPGVKHQYRITIEPCPRATAQWLRERVDVRVEYRDPAGRKYWGVYHHVSVVEAPIDSAWAGRVTLDLIEIQNLEYI